MKLTLQEKWQLLQNRVMMLNNLAHHFVGEGKVAPGIGIDADRSYYGIQDDRPIQDIVAETEAIWNDLKEEYKKIPPNV